MLRRALTSSSLLETGSLPVHLRTCVFHRFLKDQVLKTVKQNHHYRELIVKPVLKSFRALGTFPWLFSCMDTFVLPEMETCTCKCYYLEKDFDLKWSLARKLEEQNPQVNFLNLFIPSGPSMQRTRWFDQVDRYMNFSLHFSH